MESKLTLRFRIKNICKISFAIIGTIIGAGFASGQEIYRFFNIYEKKGLFGLGASIALIGIIIYKTFSICYKNNISNYQEFIKEILPNKFKDNKILRFTINNIINIFLLISFNIMVAGFSTYFNDELNIPKIYGTLLISFLCFITFINSIDGVIKVNTYLIPGIIILILILGINKIGDIRFIEFQKKSVSSFWIFSSILYASYNSITLIPILITLKDKIISKKETRLITLFVEFNLIIMSAIIFLLINSFLYRVNNVEMPMVYIANNLGIYFKFVYGIAILGAIFTTAIGSGYGFLNNITQGKKKMKIYAAIMCIGTVFVGQISFSTLINLLYPIFGYLGLIQIFFLISK